MTDSVSPGYNLVRAHPGEGTKRGAFWPSAGEPPRPNSAEPHVSPSEC
jgi:hypothetical protein